MQKRLKIAVGMSGGVDSAAAAALLKQAGHAVTGIFMKIFDESMFFPESAGHACFGPGGEDDAAAAEEICKKLGMPFHVVDLKGEYKRNVLDYVTAAYVEGKTPNPCVVCNRKLKFGVLLDRAWATGVAFQMFATGHYARIVQSGRRYLLKRGMDPSKDQSYFLYGLTQMQLSRILFPLGAFSKERVRQMAASLGLADGVRPESQDFAAGGDYASLFRPEQVQPGDIVDKNGNILGRHKGIIHYTVGQRKGLGIAAPKPLYVVRLEVDRNQVVVSDQKEDLYARGLIAGGLNWIAVQGLDGLRPATVKIRLNHKAAAATVSPLEEHYVRVEFKDPQASVTPGQSAVFYDQDTVLGGGVIERAF